MVPARGRESSRHPLPCILRAPKWLQDIADACALIRRATQDQSLVGYEQDAVVRSAVERNFEIIGEALNRIRRTDPETPSMTTSSLSAIS